MRTYRIRIRDDEIEVIAEALSTYLASKGLEKHLDTHKREQKLTLAHQLYHRFAEWGCPQEFHRTPHYKRRR